MPTDNRQEQPLCSSYADICKYHGIFLFVGYFVFRVLGWVSFTRLWLVLGEKCPYTRDQELPKSKPWWQDLGVILMLFLTIGVVYADWSQSELWSKLARFGAFYILFDMFVYHTRILWFDDLKPGRSARSSMVWSHRRILFQALINFIESVGLFTVIYRSCAKSSSAFWDVAQHSFVIATTLSAPDALVNCATWFQVLFSIFFLVVVISNVASAGYARGELAPSAREE